MTRLDAIRQRFGWGTKARGATQDDILRMLAGALVTGAGVSVTTDRALQVSTVLACARVIADGCSQVPLRLMQERNTTTGESEEARDHPLWDLLSRRPNGWQTSYEWRESMILHAVLTGNAYSYINRVRGRVYELLPLDPKEVTVKRASDWTLTYKVRMDGGADVVYPASDILHLRGPSWTTYAGMDAVRLAAEAIGLAIVTERSAAAQASRGPQVGGVLSVDGKLTPEQHEKLKKYINAHASGGPDAGGPLVVDNGATWTGTTLSAVDAQLVESRRYQVEEICRAMRVLPIMVGHADKSATYASAEQMFLAHVVHTLLPWFERIEQALDVQLLTDKERAAGLMTAFDERGLLRGALTDTANYLGTMADKGIMSRNEARRVIGLNPREGLDEPLTAVNLQPASAKPGKPASGAGGNDASNDGGR